MVEVIRFEQTDSEALQSFFRAKNWSDGLPVIVATPRGLEEYLQLAGLADQREREVGVVGPSNASAAVELVAVNALMAGCAAQHLKVVLAAIEALTQEPFNLGPLQTATNPA